MIPARYIHAFNTVFGAYSARLIARNFHALWVRGNVPPDGSARILAAQHVAWWDPLVMLHLSRRRFPHPARYYSLMDAANLRRLGFFRWIGAFGVDREDRRDAARGIRYALHQMATSPEARVLIFPQGRQRPMDARPLGCEPGAAYLAARAGTRVVPIALRYEFLEDRHPDVFASIGDAVAVPRGADGEARVEAALTDVADRLRDDVHAARMDRFERMLRGRGARDPR